MNCGWNACKLGDVITLQRGFDLPARAREDGNVPIVSSSGVTGCHTVARVQGPGVVTGRYGTLGEVFYIRQNFWPLNTTLYVRDFKGNDPLFISYFLRTLNFGQQNAAGAVPGVNRNHLHMMTVRIPHFDHQRKIAAILSTYDDLIEKNTRRIGILEEISRSLYREWFGYFRFPGRHDVPMIESDIGPIPRGWTVRRATEAIDISPQTPIPKEGDKPFVPMSGLSESSMLITEIERRTGNSGAKFRNGDTLFARITPCLENGKTAFVQFLSSDNAVAFGSTEFIVLRSRSLTPEIVYLMARSESFRNNAIQSMSGASGRQRVRESCFDSFLFAHPGRGLIARFSEVVRPMFRLIQAHHERNGALRRTRDLLLPKLISGALDVSTVDIAVAEVEP